MSSAAARHVAIVGGGFSGTLTAVNLARLCAAPLRLSVFNQGYPEGRGVAYSTRRPEHLLNVAARNMSALPEHPHHFVQWLRTRSEYSDVPDAELRETFIPRRVYGDYVRSLALHYTQPVDRRAPLATSFVADEVIDIEPWGRGARLLLADGDPVEADKVVLATGNEPPAPLPGADVLGAHPAWCANPWTEWEKRLPAAGEHIVLLGTGLTTIDAIVTLLALDWHGTIHAVSRNGLLPESHFKGVPYPAFPPTDVDLAALGLDALVRLMEEHCAVLRAAGGNPAVVVDQMRPHTQRIWQSFSDADRRAFVARYAARWNVLRHRIAPSIHGQVTGALTSGRLQLHRNRIERLEAQGSRIRVHLGDASGRAAHVDGALVINGTGPHTRFSATRSPLLRNLLARGLAQPDAMDMGIRIDRDHAVVTPSGARSPFLFALGPLLRGTLWESVAVPELRGQALHVALVLLDDLQTQHNLVPGLGETEPAVIEYLI